VGLKIKNRIMSSGKVLLSLLAGVAAGALLGILFAPEKGSVTRKKISSKAEEYGEGLKEKFNEFVDDITEKFEKVKEDVSDFKEPKKSRSESTKKDVEPATG
jgi:gas vesicle protein